MFAKYTARIRHTRLMAAARSVVLNSASDTAPNPADLIAVAFGRHQMRLTTDEAVAYLNAALVQYRYKARVDTNAY